MKKIWILLFLVVMSAFTYSQTTSYDQLLDNLVAKTELKNASIGLYAENLNTGETIFNHNSEVSLVPASVFKILPTSIALELFGPEHTFKTELAYSGSIASDGSLNGNLYIIGYGDPCLGSTNYSNHYGDLISDWVSKIKQAGIKKINGDIIADASYFNRINIPNKWLWEDLANYYANPGSSLNYMDNLYLIHFQTGNIDGSPTKITKIVPNNLNLNIDNQVLSSSTTWDESFIFFGENKNDRIIKGTLPWKKSDFPIKGSITDPELYLTKVLNDALTSAGINISGNCKSSFEIVNEQRKVFHTVYSPELSKIVETTNFKSFNLYAEMLSYHISKKTGKPYKEAVLSHLNSKGINTDGLNIEDACGLSHFNSITARQMTEWLKYMRKKSTYKDTFFASLPVAGTSGTLSRYCIGTKAQNRLHAKSGSMTRVRAYGGYILNSNGDEIVFCFIANNYACNNYGMRKIFENLFNKIAEI